MNLLKSVPEGISTERKKNNIKYGYILLDIVFNTSCTDLNLVSVLNYLEFDMSSTSSFKR